MARPGLTRPARHAARRRKGAALLAFALAGACGGTRESLVLAPATATLRVGETLRFQVAVGGDARAAAREPVSYAALGGSISREGVFVAGSRPGVHAVVASAPGHAPDTSVILVAPAGSHSYSTDFPGVENPLSEGGRWLSGASVGLDWTNVSSTPRLAIGHQVGAHFTDATAILTGSWGPDQAVSAEVHTGRQNDDCYQEAELRLRSTLAPHDNRGYEVSFKMSRTSQAYLIIVRWNGRPGDFTYLLNAHGSRFGVREGDIVSATVEGDLITAYRNGVRVGQARDGTFAGGSPGMGFNLANDAPACRGTNGDYGFRSFTAHD